MSNNEYNEKSMDSVVTEIKTILTQHVSETKEYREKLSSKLDGHEHRITSLENDRTKALGIASGVGLGGGAIGAWLKNLFT